MLVAQQPLKFKDMAQGMHVWIPDDKIGLLQIAHKNNEDDEPDIKLGEHIITERTETPDAPPVYADPRSIPIGYIVVRRLNSLDEECGDEIFIAFNRDTEAIMAGGQILIDDMVYRAFSTLKALQKANETLWNCASCNDPLNIVMGTVRICKKCEDQLSD